MDQEDELNLRLLIAAAEGNAPAVEILLRAGADATTRNKDESMPSHLAAEFGHADCIVALMKYGRDNFKYPDRRSYTPLHIAAERDHSEVVYALLKADVEPNIEMPNGITPYELALRGPPGETLTKRILLSFQSSKLNEYLWSDQYEYGKSWLDEK